MACVLYVASALWMGKITLLNDPPPPGQPWYLSRLGPLIVLAAALLKTVLGLILYFAIPAVFRRMIAR